MQTKTGIVMEVKNNIAYIMTQSGEFERVRIKYNKAKVGAIYTGEVYKKSNSIKYFVSAASVFLCVALAGSTYAYYKPVSSLDIKINDTDTKIQINKFNKIIKVSNIKKESDDLIKSLKLKHKDINEGLTKIVDASKGTNNDNNLFVEIKTNTKVKAKLDIEKFEENMKEKSIDYAIDKKVKEKNNLNAETQKKKIEEKTTKSNNTIKNSNVNIADKTVKNSKEKNVESNFEKNIKENVINENKEIKKDNKKE